LVKDFASRMYTTRVSWVRRLGVIAHHASQQRAVAHLEAQRPIQVTRSEKHSDSAYKKRIAAA
jgi:hypothetical protein